MSVRLTMQGNSVRLPVRAQPGARRNGFQGIHDGALKVAVTQVAEKGKANEALVEVLCRRLELRKSQVELIAGATSVDKQFLIHRVPLDELARRVATALEREL